MTANERSELAVLAEIMRRVEVSLEKQAEAHAALVAEVRDVKEVAHDTRRRMETVEPITKMVTSWRAGAVGAALIAGMVGTIVATGWALLRHKIADIWQVITG